MISDEIGLAIMNDCDFEDYTFNSPHNVSQSCIDAISKANTVVGDYIDNYDVLLDVCYPSLVEQQLRLRKFVFDFPIKTLSMVVVQSSLDSNDHIACFYDVRLLRLVLELMFA